MFKENLDIFTNESELAIAATLTQGSSSKTIKILFDKGYQAFSFGAEGRNIRAMAKTSDLGAIAHGDKLTIGFKTYTITRSEPIDDGAFTDLILRE